MYESPIGLIVDQVANAMVKQREDHIFQVIHRCGVNVDKDELIRALRYDRGQYDKGYQDGINEFKKTLEEKATYMWDPALGHVKCVLLEDVIGGDPNA